MTCRLFEREMSSYLDGELPAVRAARVEAHLRTCPHCMGELDALRGIAGHIRAASDQVRVRRDFDQRVLRTVGYLQVTGRRQQRALRKPLVVLGIVLLTLLGLVRHFFSQPVGPPVPVPQPAAAVAPGPGGAPMPPDQDGR